MIKRNQNFSRQLAYDPNFARPYSNDLSFVDTVNKKTVVKCNVTYDEIKELRHILSQEYCNRILRILRFPQSNVVGNLRFRYFVYDRDNKLVMKYEKKMSFKGQSFLVFSFVLHFNFVSSGVNTKSVEEKENDFTDEEENKLNDQNMIEEQEYEKEEYEDNKFNSTFLSNHQMDTQI